MSGRRLELGFEGGTVLRLTVEQSAADALVAALDNESWQKVEAEEGTYWLNPNELCYVRMVSDAPPKIGFGTAQ